MEILAESPILYPGLPSLVQSPAVNRTGGYRAFSLIGVFLVLGSSNPVAIKAAILAGWDPMSLGFFRMGVIGAVFLLWTAILGEHPLGKAGAGRNWSLAAALCKGAAVLCFYTALAHIPVSRAVILSTISPVVNLALVHILLRQERVRRHHLLGIGITLAGMLTVITVRHFGKYPADPATAGSLVGDLCMTGSIVFHQAMIIFEKRALNENVSPRQLVLSTSVVSVAAFALAVHGAGEGLQDFPAGVPATAAFLYLVTFAGVGLFLYRRWLVSLMEVTFLNSFSHAGRALSILLAVVVLGETVPFAGIAGFAIIVWGTFVALGPRQVVPVSAETG